MGEIGGGGEEDGGSELGVEVVGFSVEGLINVAFPYIRNELLLLWSLLCVWFGSCTCS